MAQINLKKYKEKEKDTTIAQNIVLVLQSREAEI